MLNWHGHLYMVSICGLAVKCLVKSNSSLTDWLQKLFDIKQKHTETWNANYACHLTYLGHNGKNTPDFT